MAMRAYWKGHLRLSLVNIGIELYTATSSSGRISLRQIHKPSGQRIHYQKIADGVGPVDTDDIVKGFELAKDEYVLLEPEDLDEIKLESRRTIDLVQFVNACEIDPRYFEKPYYVVPAEDEVAAEGFTVIREALRQSKMVGLGQMAVRGRDYVVAIRPCGKGLLLETLRFAEEIRSSDSVFDDIPDLEPEQEMLDLAEELIERKAAPFEAEAFESQYTEALRDLIEEKREAGAVSRDESDGAGSSGGRGNIVDLMEALKKSVEKGGSKKRKTSKSKRKSKSKSDEAA
ncbi:non-homologous end joining protein Ku [Hyphomonas sp.]|jgi:DNA end-binding protein Ku|uniref:non-homologous end joining protein Ku n=1 Tax=Hyphomonas sp. TaxID=87 RepID=UPI003003A65B